MTIAKLKKATKKELVRYVSASSTCTANSIRAAATGATDRLS